MVDHIFTSPEGKSYTVTGPEGSTRDQAWGMLQGQLGGETPAPAATPAAKAEPYSYGPVSDVAELGARGINAVAQMLPESIRPKPREPGPILQPANLPIFGKPSVAGMARGVYDVGEKAAGATKDVLTGEAPAEAAVGPMTEAAALLTPAAPGAAVLRRAARSALPAAEIKAAGSAGYETVRPMARARELSPEMARSTAEEIGTAVSRDVSPALAGRAHGLIGDLSNAKTLNDFVDIREKLGALVREGPGRERQAAGLARQLLNEELDLMTPGKTTVSPTSTALNVADKNYAIGNRAAEWESAMKDARLRASNEGAREGTQMRRIARPFLKEEAKNVSPEVAAAMSRVASPGVGPRALQVASAGDPTRGLGKYFGFGSLPFTFAHNPAMGIVQSAGMGAGYGAGRMYDRILRKRAENASQAMRAEAPATLAQLGDLRATNVPGRQWPLSPGATLVSLQGENR